MLEIIRAAKRHEGDPVAALGDAFEKVCRRYFFHRRTSTRDSREPRRSRVSVGVSSSFTSAARQTYVCVCVYMCYTVCVCWLGFGEHAWNTTPPSFAHTPCLRIFLFLPNEETLGLSLSAPWQTRTFLFLCLAV